MNSYSIVVLFGLAAISRDSLYAMGDSELMNRFADGEPLAFEALFERYESRIFYFMLRSVHERTVAEELAQDVFLRVIRSAAKFRRNTSFKAWIFTIARNISIDHARRQEHRETESLQRSATKNSDETREWLELIVDVHANSGSTSAVREEFRTDFELALAELPEEQRRVFVLRESEGLKYREIAKMENVSENTVKSRMRYALKGLRESLSNYEGDSMDAAENKEISANSNRKQV